LGGYKKTLNLIITLLRPAKAKGAFSTLINYFIEKKKLIISTKKNEKKNIIKQETIPLWPNGVGLITPFGHTGWW
jgi:hypothetical protein